MLQSPAGHFHWLFTNQDTPSTTPGTSVTPGASNAEGSATVIATGAQLTEETRLLMLVITGGGTSAQSKNHLFDIGVDPAGGTSYTYVVQNLTVGMSGPFNGGGVVLLLPLRIPAGAQVAVRIQGSNATAGTVMVWAKFYGRPQTPDAVWSATHSETLGTITGSRGPLVTPGVSGAEGTWTSIGTTTQRLRYWLVGLQLDDATTTAQAIWLDMAFGNGTDFHIMLEHIPFQTSGAEVMVAPIFSPNAYCDVPAGSTIYVRLSTSIGTADSNYGVTVVGLG